jgi:hypothetical protein
MTLRKLTLQPLFLCFLSVLPAAAQEETLDWLSSYKEAIAEAKRTQQPIFLEYRCEP